MKEIKNIEEIINLCKEDLDKNDENVTAILGAEDLKSLRNLLDRYKELTIIEGSHKIINGYLRERVKELEEENETLKKRNYYLEIEANKKINYEINNIKVEILKNYIPKSKVKEKIEHYEELQNNYIKKYDEVNNVLQTMINVLQELLEEQ